MALPPDDKTAKQHWLKQDAPLGRPFGSRDPGIVAVTGPEDIQALITSEAAGVVQPVYRQRTAQNVVDPVARSTNLVRQFSQKGISAEAFMAQCETVEDMTLFLALYGDMGDDKKAQTYLKLAKLLWDKQKEVLKQNNIDRAREDREVRNQVELAAKLKRHSKRGSIIDAQVTEESKSGGPQA